MNVSTRTVERWKKTWIGDETLRMICRKKHAYKVMKRTSRDSNIRRYRTLSNTVRDLTRNDHRLYLEEITKELYRNQKPFWRWLKSMRRSLRAIPDLHHQGKTLSSLAEKVNAFHSYFLSVFISEVVGNLEFCAVSCYQGEIQSMLRTCCLVKMRCLRL